MWTSSEREDKGRDKTKAGLNDFVLHCLRGGCRRSASGQWGRPKASNKKKAMDMESVNVPVPVPITTGGSRINSLELERSGLNWDPSPSTAVGHVGAESGPTPGIYTEMFSVIRSPLPLLKHSAADNTSCGLSGV